MGPSACGTPVEHFQRSFRLTEDEAMLQFFRLSLAGTQRLCICCLLGSAPRVSSPSPAVRSLLEEQFGGIMCEAAHWRDVAVGMEQDPGSCLSNKSCIPYLGVSIG